MGRRLGDGLKTTLDQYGIKGVVNRLGSMLTLFFGVDRVVSPEDARQCDRKIFARYFHGMLRRGIYLPPAPYEAMFVSLAHSNADVDKTISAFHAWARSGARG
jgi:glutamate-1-semialdehyde 2,1-aminomutase